MKALKFVLAVLGGIIVLVIVAAVIFINTFDPNSLKDDLTAYVYERTGRTLVIEDSIELSLFPWFAVETGGVSLSDDPAFGDRNLVTVEELSARVRVWPLLKRRVEIGRVIFDGINLNLGIDADGRGNWASLLDSGDDRDVSTATTPTSERRSFEQLAVEGIELRNARIRWHDANGEVLYLVRDLDLRTGMISNTEPVELALSMSLLDVGTQASLELQLDAIGALAPAPRLSDISATFFLLDARETERMSATVELESASYSDRVLRTSPLRMTTQLTRPPVGPETLRADISLGALELDAAGETVQFTNLRVSNEQVTADIDLRGAALFSDPQLGGSIALRGGSLADLLSALELDTAPEIGELTRSPFSGSTDFALQAQTVSLRNLQLNALGLSASGHAERTGDGMLSGRFELPAFAVEGPVLELLQSFAPEGLDLSGVSMAAASTGFRLPADSARLELTNLDVTVDSAQMSGNVSITGPAGARHATGDVSLSGLDNALLAATASGLIPDSLIEAELGTFELDTDFSYDFASQVAELDPMRLTAYGLSGDGQLMTRRVDGELVLSGQASLAQFSPRELLARFDQPVPSASDPTVLHSARLAASFETNGSNGRFRDIAIDLDDTHITGEFSVDDFADPSYRFVLRADQVDVDRYLPPSGTAAEEEDEEAERRVGDVRIQIDPLTDLVVQGSASVGDLTVAGMRYEQFSSNLTIGGGRANLSDVNMHLYGGEFAGGFAVDAQGGVPTIHLTGVARNVALEPLLTAMLGDSHISGAADFTLDLGGTGSTIGDAMRTAAGSMSVTFRDGVLEGFNLGRELCETMNELNGLPDPERATESTAYSRISGTATVREGIAGSADMLVVTPYLRMTGAANMQLVDQRINSNYDARMTGPVNLRGCERLNSRIDDSVPFGFSLDGKLPDVQVGFDISQLLQDMFKRELRNDITERLLDRLIN